VRGRPQTQPREGARNSLGLKVTAWTKQALSDAAQKSGRTMSQEAEARIIWSFQRGRLLDEVLDAARAGTLSDWAHAVEEAVTP
jgi:hypothetical protein